MKQKRKEQIRKRKNFLPTLLVTVILWMTTAGIVYFVDPDTLLIIPTFFLFVFLSLLFTFSTIFASSRRGLITSFGLTLFLILRYLGVGNILNLLLILGLGITLEFYMTKKG